ncbi:MAG: penicillin-binding protein 2 [Chloroflexi bacterium]|nr:MAG: penicillin-binding protein 2 [Chloroflexota bacterium]
MANRSGGVTWRLWAVIAAMGVGTLIMTGRLAQLQIVDHPQYAEEARLSHNVEQTVTDRRGALLDRNGYPLAASEDTFDVMVERDAWKARAPGDEAVSKLTGVIGVPAQQLLDQLNSTDIFEVDAARNLSFEKAEAVRKAGLDGVRLVSSSHRVYPEGNMAAQVLGFVGRDSSGLTGLEADLDSVLAGTKGSLTAERDGLGRDLAFGRREEVAPQPGADVVLTIDRYIQRLAEQELDRTVKENKASGGTIVVVQPKTGEILAMASRPTFDVTALDLSDDSKLALYRDRAITDMYEPGSVFKLVTTAAALDLGLVSPDTWWYDSGVFKASEWSIHNWDFSANGPQTVQQMLSKSLNTGAAWVAQQLGPDRFYDYVSRFGFGRPSGIGLSGDAPGRVRTPQDDGNWRDIDMATNSFGQGISVTPLQMAMAVATIANNGLAMKPQIVKETVSPAGRQSNAPQPLQQVISPASAQTLRNMMGVVVDGINKHYLDVQGYKIGGKTGTANLATADAGYKDQAYISSFVGIAPLDDPAIAVLVKIDEPQGVPWGTVVAAPAFSRLVQQTLTYLNIPPTEEALVSKLGQ